MFSPKDRKSIILVSSGYQDDIIKSLILCDPFISISKLKSTILTVSGIVVSKKLVRIAIHKLGISKKKARFYGVSSSTKQKTEEFLYQRNQLRNVLYLSMKLLLEDLGYILKKENPCTFKNVHQG